jgi:hypothetical protein
MTKKLVGQARVPFKLASNDQMKHASLREGCENVCMGALRLVAVVPEDMRLGQKDQ